MATLEADDMIELYPLSKSLLARTPDTFDPIEAHDPADAESPDLLWIAGAEHSDLCDGEYIAPSRLGENSWHVSHNSADKVGGHPTHWDMSGNEKADFIAKAQEGVMDQVLIRIIPLIGADSVIEKFIE